METIWCEIEERNVSKGKCLYVKGGTRPNNPTCPKCDYFKSLFPLDTKERNVSLKKTVKQPATKKKLLTKKTSVKALLEDTTGWFPESVHLTLEAYRKHYEEDQDPIWLMRAYVDAYRNKVPIPEWINKVIDGFFGKYLFDDYRSLDVLFGCKGSGKKKSKKRLDLRGKDVRLMTDMGRLIQQGMIIADAAEVVSFCRHGQPSAETIRQMYYEKKSEPNVSLKKTVKQLTTKKNQPKKKPAKPFWEIKKIQSYSYPNRTKALLKLAAKALLQKYPNMRIIRKKYPHLFEKIN